MNAIREIVNSSIFNNIIYIPEEMKNKKVEVIILPVDSTYSKKDFNPEDYIGTLKIKNIDESLNEIRNEWDRTECT